MFKKRTANRPNGRQRELESEDAKEELRCSGGEAGDEDEVDKAALEDLKALRNLRRARKGIDASKLNIGDTKVQKKRKPQKEEEGPTYGLQRPGESKMEVEEDDDDETKSRKIVRSNNFTQQTNALDVDKHMMAYIEENLKLRRGDAGNDDDMNLEDDAPFDPHDELFRIDEKYKIKKKVVEEGNVTNSMAMLTAIPEVDLGMDVRLKNIEETEKAKRRVAEERQARLQSSRSHNSDDIASARFYRPHQNIQSDADALKNAQLEAMGIEPEPEIKRRPNQTGDGRKPEMATDDMVMERFKKRMRR